MPLLSIIEDDSRHKLANQVVRIFETSQGSFLCLSGDDAKFAKCIAEYTSAESLIYASDLEANLENAENDGVTSTKCDLTDAKTFRTLGKYDGVVVKDVLEHNFLNVQDLLDSIWKLLKLEGTAVLLLRPSPPFPMPSGMCEIWGKAVPDLENVLDLAHDEDQFFESNVTDVETDVKISKEDLRDLLYSFSSAEELDINVLLENIKTEEVEFKDVVTLVSLKKVID